MSYEFWAWTKGGGKCLAWTCEVGLVAQLRKAFKELCQCRITVRKVGP
jgi:hypothetical protein